MPLASLPRATLLLTLLLVNGDAQDSTFMLPAGVWQVILDTTHPTGKGSWHGQGERALPFERPLGEGDS